jgi:uncharacterized protein YaaW (UPF0174 family)
MNELRSALELANPEELKTITNILFTRKFNPIDYLQTPDPIEVQSQDYDSYLDHIEKRFFSLAADGLTVLKGKVHTITYRQTLMRVCEYLKIPYSQQITTLDMEAEIFVKLLDQAWEKLPSSEQKLLSNKVAGKLEKTSFSQPLPSQFHHEPIKLILKGSSAVLTSMIKTVILKIIVQEFTLHFATYQAAKTALVKGGLGKLQQYILLKTAQKGMIATAAKYGIVRGVFSLLTPVMWGWFFADLGWRAIDTNYGRIIPTIFILAQVRLLKNSCT